MQTVVITGSTRGLGYQLAKQFLSRDYNVVISGTKDDTIDKAMNSLREIQGTGTGKVAAKKCNVSMPEDVEALADFALEQFGSIDIWINNAGANQSHQFVWDISPDEIDFLLNVDLKGAINGTCAAIRHMISQGSGSIYNVEGMGSNDAFQSCFSIYGTAKRAVTYFTDATAHELEEKKLPITICKLSPGIMITDFLTSAKGQQHTTNLDDKTRKIYNILGDYPDVIARYLVDQIEKHPKNGQRIAWLTGTKAAFRFMTAGFQKRDFFGKD